MSEKLVPDADVPGAFWVKFGDASQSWVDPARPDFLAFEYTQHIAVLLDCTVFLAPPEQRMRVVHVGGGGLTMPRWVAWRRPGTAQIVCEPDADLTLEVRRKLPLPARSGIKVRGVDGMAGVAAMPSDYADVVIVDAFAGAQVPGELVTAEYLTELGRVGRDAEAVIFNVTDRMPFAWTKRLAAGMAARWRNLVVAAESPVFKGRRFGNLLLLGSQQRIDATAIDRQCRRLPAGYRLLLGRELCSWIGGSDEFTQTDTSPSPPPTGFLR